VVKLVKVVIECRRTESKRIRALNKDLSHPSYDLKKNGINGFKS
jgi:hypothetical protein